MADFDICDLQEMGRWIDVNESTFPIVKVEVYMKEGVVLYLYLDSNGDAKSVTIHIPKGSMMEVYDKDNKRLCDQIY